MQGPARNRTWDHQGNFSTLIAFDFSFFQIGNFSQSQNEFITSVVLASLCQAPVKCALTSLLYGCGDCLLHRYTSRLVKQRAASLMHRQLWMNLATQLSVRLLTSCSWCCRSCNDCATSGSCVSAITPCWSYQASLPLSCLRTVVLFTVVPHLTLLPATMLRVGHPYCLLLHIG